VAVGGDNVDLVRGVLPMDETLATAATAAASDNHDVPVSIRPLALDTNQSRPKIENQVVALVIKRLEDSDASFHGGEDHCLFGHYPFLIRGQHPPRMPMHADGLLPAL